MNHLADRANAITCIETITTELVLADLESAQKQIEKRSKDAKRGDKGKEYVVQDGDVILVKFNV